MNYQICAIGEGEFVLKAIYNGCKSVQMRFEKNSNSVVTWIKWITRHAPNGTKLQAKY